MKLPRWLRALTGGRSASDPKVPLDRQAYTARLRLVLEAEMPRAAESLQACLDRLHPKTDSVDIGVHPDQDGEGFVTIMVHPVGPDLSVLAAAIAPHSALFDVRIVDGKVHPPVPLVDPLDTPFDVQEVIWQVASDWSCSVWRQVAGGDHPKAGQVFVASDFAEAQRPLNS